MGTDPPTTPPERTGACPRGGRSVRAATATAARDHPPPAGTSPHPSPRRRAPPPTAPKVAPPPRRAVERRHGLPQQPGLSEMDRAHGGPQPHARGRAGEEA